MREITTREAYKMYDEMLDYEGPVSIAGLYYDVSYILKRIDRVAYDTMFNDYMDTLIVEETDTGYIINE